MIKPPGKPGIAVYFRPKQPKRTPMLLNPMFPVSNTLDATRPTSRNPPFAEVPWKKNIIPVVKSMSFKANRGKWKKYSPNENIKITKNQVVKSFSFNDNRGKWKKKQSDLHQLEGTFKARARRPAARATLGSRPGLPTSVDWTRCFAGRGQPRSNGWVGQNIWLWLKKPEFQNGLPW